jgi:hypothetical protein
MMHTLKELEADGDFHQTYVGSYGILGSRQENSKRPDRTRMYKTLLNYHRSLVQFIPNYEWKRNHSHYTIQ